VAIVDFHSLLRGIRESLRTEQRAVKNLAIWDFNIYFDQKPVETFPLTTCRRKLSDNCVQQCPRAESRIDVEEVVVDR
jgi:hypothetical protein